MPEGLSEIQKQLWTKTVAAIPLAIRRPGVEDAIFRHIIALADVINCNRELADGPIVVMTERGMARDPRYLIRNVAMSLVERTSRELGLPAAVMRRVRE